MGPRGVLIRCSGSRPEIEEEIERWLARRVRAIAGEGAILYRYAPSPGDAAAGRSGGAWVVELGAPREAGEPHAVFALLGEMRMLGLDPALFRAGE